MIKKLFTVTIFLFVVMTGANAQTKDETDRC